MPDTKSMANFSRRNIFLNVLDEQKHDDTYGDHAVAYVSMYLQITSVPYLNNE